MSRDKLIEAFLNGTPPPSEVSLFPPPRPDLSMVSKKLVVRSAQDEPVQVMGPIPKPPPTSSKKSKRNYLYLAQSGLCRYCDLPFSSTDIPTLDHIVPKVKGGKDDLSNLALVHQSCNEFKGSYTSFEQVALHAAATLEASFHTQSRVLKQLAYFKKLKEKGIVK